jgi:hypothetical protein
MRASSFNTPIRQSGLSVILFLATLCGGATAASTLVGITTPDGQFVRLNSETGSVTPLANLLTPPQTFAQPGVDAQNGSSLMFVIRHEENGDVLLTIDTATGAVFRNTVLTRPLAHLGFDAQTGGLFGITQPDVYGTSDFVLIDPAAGIFAALTQPGSPADGTFSQPGVDATDLLNDIFYVIRRSSTGDTLLGIDTLSGAIVTAAPLTRHMAHLAFSSVQNILFGITSDGTAHDLVKIDPATGALTTVRSVGSTTQQFARPGVDSMDVLGDIFYVIRSSASGDELLAIDLSSNAADHAVSISAELANIAVTERATVPSIIIPSGLSGVVGLPIQITVTATGDPAPAIFAELFPFGSIVSQTVNGNTTTAVISFTPLFTGIFGFTIIAQNSQGSTSAVLSIDVQDIPSFTSTSFVLGIQNSLFNFPLLLSTLSSSSITTSTLPDGLSLSGNVITGTPTTTGTFGVDVMAETPAGTVTQKLVIQIVNSEDVGNGNAGNGAGKILPPPNGSGAPTEISVAKAAIDLNFASPGRDRASFSGVLSVPRGFVAAGQAVSISINGIAERFTLDARGRAKNANASVSINAKGRFSASFSHGAFSGAFANALENATVSRQPRSVHVSLSLGAATLSTDVSLTYSAVAGQKGRARK